MMIIFCVVAIGMVVVPSLQASGPIRDMTISYMWNNLEYWFETAEDYQYAIANGLYIEEGFKLPYDVDIYVKQRGHGHGESHGHGDSHGHGEGHGHGDSHGHGEGHGHGDSHEHWDSHGHGDSHEHWDSHGHGDSHEHWDSHGHGDSHEHWDSHGHGDSHEHWDSHGHGDGHRQKLAHHHGNDDVTIFITTPKVNPGIPYTLATVSNLQGKYGPKLLPYPNFSAHSPYDTPTCDRIISVFRIYVDPCNRLWVIDSGRDFFAANTQVCPPKILVYDLKTDELILKYTVPEGQYIPSQSAFSGIIVDIYDPPPQGKCQMGKVYVTDQRGYSLLVFDLASVTSWVIYNNQFKYDPAHATITIAGESFINSGDGLYTNTPFRRGNKIFLHSLTSLNELAAPLNIINDKSLWLNNPSGNPRTFQVIGSRPTQSLTQTMDSHGNIYFSLLDPLEIVSWNPSLPYNLANFKPVALNSEDLQYVIGLKVRHNSENDEILLGLSNRFQKAQVGTMSLSEINFRIMVCKISTLQMGRGDCGDL